MNKFLTAALFGIAVCANAQAGNLSPKSVFAEYSYQKGDFENDSGIDMRGFGIGLSSSQQAGGWWGKFEYQSNSDFDGKYYEVSGGGHYSLLSAERYYALGTIGMGVGVLDAEGFDNTSYFSIPLGLEVGVNINKNFSMYGGVGYKWAFDISNNDKTRCNDGSTSNSSGSGTCSWHGGVNYNYTANNVGDFDGVTYKAGLRYNF